MWKLLKNLRQDESGQDLIEYALIAALIALGAVVSMKAVAPARCRQAPLPWTPTLPCTP